MSTFTHIYVKILTKDHPLSNFSVDTIFEDGKCDSDSDDSDDDSYDSNELDLKKYQGFDISEDEYEFKIKLRNKKHMTLAECRECELNLHFINSHGECFECIFVCEDGENIVVNNCQCKKADRSKDLDIAYDIFRKVFNTMDCINESILDEVVRDKYKLSLTDKNRFANPKYILQCMDDMT